MSKPDPEEFAKPEPESLPAAAPEPPATAVPVTPEAPPASHDPDEDLLPMFGGELVRLILAAGGEGSRAGRAFELLAERGTSDYLLDDLELLCRSGDQDQQLRAARVMRNLRLPSDERHGQRTRDLLLRLVDQRNEPAIVAAARAALGTSEG
jgi:hypothetical protein